MRRAVIFLITLYQKLISPLFAPRCRFYPSCSEYAKEVVSRHGVIKGGGLAVWRLLRCGPWTKGGFDPAP